MIMVAQRLKREFVVLVAYILIGIPDGLANTTMSSPSESDMTSVVHMTPSPSANNMTSMMNMTSSTSASNVTSRMNMTSSASPSNMTSTVHMTPSPSASDMLSTEHAMSFPSASNTTSMTNVVPSASPSNMTSTVHMTPSPSASDISSMMQMMSSPSATDTTTKMAVMPSPSASEMVLTATPCSPGFTGGNCSKNIDDCLHENCSGNGSCTDKVNGFLCVCDDGYFGENCEKQVSACNPNPCENDGTCIVDDKTFKCTCTRAFEGKTCLSEKPTQTLAATMKLDKEYDNAYSDINSPKSLALKTDLNRVLIRFFQAEFPDLIGIKYKRFFEGSVGVDYELIFPTTSNVTTNNIVQALKDANGTKELGFLSLTGDITVTKQVVQTTVKPTGTSGKIKDWEIVLIAAAAIIFFLIVAICVLAIKYRNAVRDEKRELYALDGNWELMENGSNGLRAHPDFKSRNAPQSYVSPMYDKVSGSDNKAYHEDSAL